MTASSSTTSARPIIVQKYGGSSVADIEKLRRVADRVVACKRDGYDVVVVVSAMGKTTDGLIELAHAASTVDGERAAPTRRELDMLVSTGERVTMSLLSIAVQARGAPAISFTGSQSGILTNDRHFDARIIEVRPHRIEDELARGNIVIVAGYQGMSYRREITTLGRGGSDTTAVALAAALGAERCEIYSDVDGVYSADPRIVADAQHLPQLNHEMLQEMAEAGAKVVCAQAVEWARRHKIAIYARSTFEPGRESIVREGVSETMTARAVVCDPKVALVSLAADPSCDAHEVAARFETLAIPWKDLIVADGACSFVIPLGTLPSPESALGEILSKFPLANIRRGVSQVSVVGDGLAMGGGPLRRFTTALRRCEIIPTHVSANPLRLAAIVGTDEAARAQNELHAEFIR